QANIALDYDPSLTGGHLLKGQLLLTLQRYAEAAAPLEENLRRKPDDAAARKLLRLAQAPREDGPYLKEIVNVFEAQEFFAGMGHVNDVFLKRVVGPLQERLPGYRKQIDAGWPGLKLGNKLFIHPSGELWLNGLPYGDTIRSLQPLQGIPITHLDLRGLHKIDSLEPLRGMPLTWLSLMDTGSIPDLGPLQGMKLTFLHIKSSGPIRDFKPLA